MPPRRVFEYRCHDNGRTESAWQHTLCCDTCKGTTKSGAACSRRVCIGLPLCWQHAMAVYGVRIRDSDIAGAGKGLFATRPFAKDEAICPYGGADITAAVLERRYPGDCLAPYAVRRGSSNPPRFEDAAHFRGIGAMANGQGTRQSSTNAVFRARQGRVWLVASRAIRAGTEIVAHYGTDYWSGSGHEVEFRIARRNGDAADGE